MSPDAKISVLGTDSSVSEKPLQLVLVSTTVGSTPSESTAALGTDPRNPQTYAVGSVLVNGAVIKEIQPDHIVLEENGRRTSVAVDHGVSARLAVKDSLLHSKHVSPTVLASLSEAPGHKSALTVGGKASDSESVGRPRGLGGDFSQILRSQLVFERDKVAGFQIFAGSRRSALSQLGLKEGDIVRTIDGRPIEGADAWLTIGNAVSSGSSIVVGIERDGSLLPIMLDGAVLDGSPEFEVSPRG
jgi:general secretion pathway protein C